MPQERARSPGAYDRYLHIIADIFKVVQNHAPGGRGSGTETNPKDS